jgi:signal peptidase I
MNNAKKVLNTVSSILVWILVVFAICMTIFTVVSVTTFDKTNRSVFGFHFFVVMSDSMSASGLNAGDIAIVKEVSDPATLKEGDIISYASTASESFGETITHMIRKKTTDKNGNPVHKFLDSIPVYGVVTFRVAKGSNVESDSVLAIIG